MPKHEIPAQAGRLEKIGEWEAVRCADGSMRFRCSACRKFSFHNGEMRKKYRFCPGCGAQIRGTKENET